MAADRFLNRARRALRRPPGYLLRRLLEAGRVRIRQRWSRIYQRFVTAQGIAWAAGALSIDALWNAQQKLPFFISPSNHSSWAQAFAARFADRVAAIVHDADRALGHEFDLLGSGPVNLGPKLPWH